MIIPSPISAMAESPWTTKLFFKDGFRRFYLRGAVCFPDAVNAIPDGFAMLAGLNVDTREEKNRKVWIFEDLTWLTVENWLDDSGGLKQREDGGFYMGLDTWMADILSRYACASYFYGGQHPDLTGHFRKGLYRSPKASERMELIEVPNYAVEIGRKLVGEWGYSKRIAYDRDSLLAKGLETAQAGFETSAHHALCVLLAGFEHLPWVGGDNL